MNIGSNLYFCESIFRWAIGYTYRVVFCSRGFWLDFGMAYRGLAYITIDALSSHASLTSDKLLSLILLPSSSLQQNKSNCKYSFAPSVGFIFML
jgi:hypothetical protein